MPYRVLVDDNYHFMDESERYNAGTFETADAAIARCRAIVEACLQEVYQPAMTAAALYASYTMFGDDPFLRCIDAPAVSFGAWDYARARCEQICGSTTPASN